MMDDVRLLAGTMSALATLTVLVAAPTARADEHDPLYELVNTAAARLATADAVAAFKWVQGGSIEDPDRVAQVLDAVASDATSRGVDPAFTRRAFEDQIHATESVEYSRFAQWKLDPAAAPTTAPDLSESRTAIDGFNREMVGQMASQWNVLRGPHCARDLAQATGAVTTERKLDPMYHRALTFATHSYCS